MCELSPFCHFEPEHPGRSNNGYLCDHHRFERHLSRLNGGTHANFVYYAQRCGDRIKIGSTEFSPRRRARDLGCVLLAFEPGNAHLEGQRLNQFRLHRIPGLNEWFRPAPDLLDHIASLALVASLSDADRRVA